MPSLLRVRWHHRRELQSLALAVPQQTQEPQDPQPRADNRNGAGFVKAHEVRSSARIGSVLLEPSEAQSV
jgi:hypothetical protein